MSLELLGFISASWVESSYGFRPHRWRKPGTGRWNPVACRLSRATGFSNELVQARPTLKLCGDRLIARLEALPRPPSIERRDDEELPERAGL